jgi:hydroxymethylpyrimidine pyrophosphatase-like HAD family hydrolase
MTPFLRWLPPGQRRDALLNLLQLSVIYNLEPSERECGGSICAPDPGFRRPGPIRLRPRYPLVLSKAGAGAGRSFQLEQQALADYLSEKGIVMRDLGLPSPAWARNSPNPTGNSSFEGAAPSSQRRLQPARVLLAWASDLDDTLFHGEDSRYDGSLPVLFDIIAEKQPELVFITGRRWRELVMGLEEYQTPIPNTIFTEIGTVRWRRGANGSFERDPRHEAAMSSDTPNWNDAVIRRELLDHIPGLALRPPECQNPFRASFQIDGHHDAARAAEVVADITELLVERLHCENARVVQSRGAEHWGLDVLPRLGTKSGALGVWAKELRLQRQQLMFSGDGGLDVDALAAGFPAVLVRNADHSTRDRLAEIRTRDGLQEVCIFAEGLNRLNGCFSSGIVEGLIRHGFIEESWSLDERIQKRE